MLQCDAAMVSSEIVDGCSEARALGRPPRHEVHDLHGMRRLRSDATTASSNPYPSLDRRMHGTREPQSSDAKSWVHKLFSSVKLMSAPRSKSVRCSIQGPISALALTAVPAPAARERDAGASNNGFNQNGSSHRETGTTSLNAEFCHVEGRGRATRTESVEPRDVPKDDGSRPRASVWPKDAEYNVDIAFPSLWSVLLGSATAGEPMSWLKKAWANFDGKGADSQAVIQQCPVTDLGPTNQHTKNRTKSST